jgi:hypothetical protein
MGASDYKTDLPPGLSPGLGRTPLQPSFDPPREPLDTWIGIVIAAIIVISIVAAHLAALHRRKIARAADAALISGLATGVRAARSVASKKDALIERVRAKADEKPSEQD